MRRVILGVAVLLPLTAPAYAKPSQGQCQAIAASATLIMTNRQYGVPRSETQRYVFNIRDREIRGTVQSMVGLAYGVSIASTQSEKQRAVTSFRNRYAHRCN